MILTVTANPAIDRVYLVDQFIMGEVHRPLDMTYTAGGKGLNVSRVSAILGEQVCATGFLGGDTGNYIRREVKKLGIEDAFVETGKETRSCINISDKNGISGEILEPGPMLTAQDEAAFFAKLESLLDGCRIVTVSGSQPKGLSEDFYSRIVESARNHGKKTIVDTSGSSLTRIVAAKPFMVKPNRYELSQYLGTELQDENDCKDALKLLFDRGVEVPLCSLGKDGAMAYIDGSFYRFVPPKVQIINSVGSGDSTVAGIAVGISRNWSIPDAIRLGMAAGASNTQFRKTGYVDQAMVEEFYKQIQTIER